MSTFINVGIQVRERIEEHIMGNRTRKTNVLDGKPHLRCFASPIQMEAHDTYLEQAHRYTGAAQAIEGETGLRDDERLYIANEP